MVSSHAAVGCPHAAAPATEAAAPEAPEASTAATRRIAGTSTHGSPQAPASKASPRPRDLMRPFPADLMRMWPISTRVNKPENDDPSIAEPIQFSTDAA
jgi:hypothetical protein